MAAADKFVYAAARLHRAKRYALANSSLHPLITCTASSEAGLMSILTPAIYRMYRKARRCSIASWKGHCRSATAHLFAELALWRVAHRTAGIVHQQRHLLVAPVHLLMAQSRLIAA